MSLDSSREQTSHGSSNPVGWLADSAADCWSGLAKTASEHKVLSAGIALAGTAAAYAAFKGRGGAVVEAVTATTKPAAELIGADVSAARLLSQTEPVMARSLAEGVWISTPEHVSPGGIHLLSPSGIQLVTTDLSKAGAALVDAHPQIPKLVISDPILRAGGLITDFEGDLPGLYKTAQSSVVRLQVTRMDGVVKLAKTGSGVFINPEGELGTAHHVIAGGEHIQVFGALGSSTPMEAAVKFADPVNDVAVLKLVNPKPDFLKDLKVFLARPESEAMKASEQVVAFGYPDGVSTLQAMPGNFSNWKTIQLGTEANMTGNAMRSFMEVGPGTSGGAFVDKQGRLAGIVVQMQPQNHAGWAVPISRLTF